MSAVGGDILTGMSMGRSRVERQQNLWIATAALPRSKGDPFYEKLNGLLDEAGFDEYVEGVCAGFYAPVLGRPSPGAGAATSGCCWWATSRGVIRSGRSRGGCRTR